MKSLVLIGSLFVSVLAGVYAAPVGEESFSCRTGETVRVAYRTRDGRQEGAAAFSGEIATLLLKRCGYRIEPARDLDEIDVGLDVDAEVDVLAGVFRSVELSREWRFVPTCLGKLDVSVFAPAALAERLKELNPHDWPRLRIAVSKEASGFIEEFRNWRARELPDITEIEYETVSRAREALGFRECSLLLDLSIRGTDELIEVARVGSRPYFIGVRHGRNALYQRMSREAERLFVEDPRTIDRLRTKCLGYVPPKRRVRVGRYFESGLCEYTAGGLVYGANVDYVERIAEVAGWNVEWVDCVYPHALEYLEKGDLDVLAGVTITPERLEKLAFPHLATGLYTTYLFCRDQAPFRSGYISQWTNAVIGTGFGEQANRALGKFLDDNGCRCEVKTYDSFASAVRAYFRGECQIVHAASSPQFANERVLYAFEPVPSYVVATRKRPELVGEIQRALERINAHDPGFHEEVARRNFLPRKANGFNLSDAEYAYLRKRMTEGENVRLEIFPSLHPLKFWHRASCGGFLPNLLEIVERRCRMNFRVLEPMDFTTARRRFLDGECDFWVDYGADTTGLPYRFGTIDEVNLMDGLICRRDTKLLDPASGRVAVPKWELRSFGYGGGRVGRGENLLPCESIDDCIRAVKRGDADCVVCSVLVAASALKRIDSNGELMVRPPDIGRRKVPFRLIPSPKADPRLVSIVSKLFGSLTQLEIETAESAAVVDFIHSPVPAWARILNAAVLMALLLVLVIGFGVYRRNRALVAEARRSEEFARERDQAIKELETDLDEALKIIETRTDDLRNPAVKHESVVAWTNEIVDAAMGLVMRFRRLVGGADSKPS